MNRKTIIIGIVVVGLIIGATYIYNQRQKAILMKDVVTEKDAMEVLELLNKREYSLSDKQSKSFVSLYVANINKDIHEQIKSLLNKKESDWTTQDKINFFTLITKVITPVKNTILN